MNMKNDGYYTGSIVGCGHVLTATDGTGLATVNRKGTKLNELAYGKLYDRRSGTIAQRRRAQHATRKAVDSIERSLAL